MPSSRQQRSDFKLLAASTVAVLVVGLLVAGGIWLLTDTDAPECGVFNAGLASDIRARVEEGGPYFVSGGGNCGFLAALDGDELVAVRLRDPERGCEVRWQGENQGFRCGGEPIPLDDLSRYATSLGTGDLDGAFLVDFRSAGTASTGTP